MLLRISIFILLFPFFLIPACKEKEAPKYVIGFSQCTGDDAWRRDMLRGMQRELAFHPEVDFLYRDAKGNSGKQVEQIKELLTSNINLLIVSPNEAEPITPVVEQAYQNGIPVVVVDRKTASSFYTAYVGGNNYEVGKTAGQYIGAYLHGKGKVVEITGLPTSSPSIERHKGFLDAIRNYPNIQVIRVIAGDWEKKIAKQKLTALFDSIKQADLVFAQNEVMALGTYEVWRERGISPRTKIVGIDGLAGPLGDIQMVHDGLIDATVLYPTGGEEAIRTAVQILEKKPFTKENILNTAVIDPTNVRMIKMQTDKILNQQEDIERQQKHNEEQLRVYNNQRILLYTISGLLVVAIVLGCLALYSLVENKKINKILKLKNRKIIQQRNKIQEMADEAQAATESKFKFFTNISHEFRTPLTLILGPIDSLLHGKSDHLMVKQSLRLIQKNASRLLWLVNQLMDFRKLESGMIQVKATENDLIAFMREVMQPFEPMAKKSNIEFKLITNLSVLPVWFDVNMMDKVFFNLLSNAFKFTKTHGRIHILIEQDAALNQVHVKVRDTGIGMTEMEVNRAFELFYQANQDSNKGTGLGLPLSKEFIQLHHGEITVKSEPHQGTTFTIQLLLGSQHFKEEEKISAVVGEEGQLSKLIVAETGPIWQDSSNNESKSESILVIEDHPDLRSFLQYTLQANYQVFTAGEGELGLTKAIEKVPDLIICDLMLPDMKGIKVVASLKADLRTSHIPIIILTALNGLEQQIEGMQVGAELYLTKPFSPQVLKESVKSLLANRRLVKDYFANGEVLSPANSPSISKLDQKFLNDFKRIIDEKLADPNLSVDFLSREIGLSRVQLYRKVKALLNGNVNDYIQTARLTKSCHLLQQTSASIADVAYQVGFSSSTYFATAFKAKYGISPTDYKMQKSYLKTV
ncbi:substrate-binding domain-containing protein [Adhaeribacter radiodurans]|uniref:histidine kinase n=1 Tax=Adhaeribacter radiodurans TaxID=2745197 RepID=A0A7L7L9G6_9BACT|nr:substrate-binding domain-containing protein [Adhaeribacter radiodurans]QMU29471.1 substrate-binding domain-containing protein [Adhaeribacter radiodurans]